VSLRASPREAPDFRAATCELAQRTTEIEAFPTENPR
jgi:hypothetical protein